MRARSCGGRSASSAPGCARRVRPTSGRRRCSCWSGARTGWSSSSQFYPKGVQTGGRPALFFKVAQFTAPVLELTVVAETWLEAGDGQKSETKVSVLEFADGSTYEPWESFFSAIQLEFFEAAPRLAVRLRLPFAARQAAAHPGAWLQRRWPIPDFARQAGGEGAAPSTSGTAARSAWATRPSSCASTRRSVVGASSEQVGVYLHAAGLGERAPLVCEAELWLENEAGERLHKCAASILFDSLGGWGCRNYATLKRVQKLRSGRREAERAPPPAAVGRRAARPAARRRAHAAAVGAAGRDARRGADQLARLHRLRPASGESRALRAAAAARRRGQSGGRRLPASGVVATLDVAALSDAEVHAKGRVFKVSRAVLAAASPRFWALFADASTPEATSGVVRMDAEPALVHALLLAAYGAPLPEDAPVERLLPLAVEFQLEGLITACSDALVAALTLENVFERLELAARPQQPALLRTAVFRFARQHLAQLAGLKPFIQFAQQQPTILSAVCALEEPSRP
ncbi:Speckle-type POZ protein A-like protein [Aphelenchoides fujianensis]|nr:Speckle-type POZ protein A-like protein [Aphelenchoides fujianensis]